MQTHLVWHNASLCQVVNKQNKEYEKDFLPNNYNSNTTKL